MDARRSAFERIPRAGIWHMERPPVSFERPQNWQNGPRVNPQQDDHRQCANISPPCMAESGDIGAGSPGTTEVTADAEPVREEASAIERGHTSSNERTVRGNSGKRKEMLAILLQLL
ncbi:hypothetical protein R1flu_006785 [Riccia fluitans]|uniref:Uncharacterized protein n=1 Tax=Riccia fluitans TaxID=41844 RepID=A0ABD1YX09_9MARC